MYVFCTELCLKIMYLRENIKVRTYFHIFIFLSNLHIKYGYYFSELIFYIFANFYKEWKKVLNIFKQIYKFCLIYLLIIIRMDFKLLFALI